MGTAVVAFIFTFYVLSFFFDLRPKARTKEEFQMETREFQQTDGQNRRSLAARFLGRKG